jgi:CxxC motif-containing protein (DUF1111 family)
MLLAGAGGSEQTGRREFTNPRDPPAYASLDDAERTRVDLGHAVFNTQWVPAGAGNAGRRAGLGPLFNAPACDACHNEGAHGRGPAGDGPAPIALVIELDLPAAGAKQATAGDPRYGHTLNTAAIEGFEPEAAVTLRYEAIVGHYPDGSPWKLRAPRYQLSNLKYGPLDPRTTIEPRLAPALFGVGLIEAVPNAPANRFGWQGTAISIRDQTTKAFSRDMGLTSTDVPTTDCTAAQPDCLAAPRGGSPEVSEDLLQALVEFQRTLAVPARAPAPPGAGFRLFVQAGCSACHRPSIPVAGSYGGGTIDAFTDLAFHELGSALADHEVAGHTALSRWRTAPLWGMAYRILREKPATFLHDGRARSIEEAILWHRGEAESARSRFVELSRDQRTELLRWVESL